MTKTLKDHLGYLAEVVNKDGGKGLWDIITALRGPDSPSEIGSSGGPVWNALYEARRARKYKTTEIIRAVAGLHGGAARYHMGDHVIVPTGPNQDHFDKHVVKAANALGIKVIYQDDGVEAGSQLVPITPQAPQSEPQSEGVSLGGPPKVWKTIFGSSGSTKDSASYWLKEFMTPGADMDKVFANLLNWAACNKYSLMESPQLIHADMHPWVLSGYSWTQTTAKWVTHVLSECLTSVSLAEYPAKRDQLESYYLCMRTSLYTPLFQLSQNNEPGDRIMWVPVSILAQVGINDMDLISGKPATLAWAEPGSPVRTGYWLWEDALNAVIQKHSVNGIAPSKLVEFLKQAFDDDFALSTKSSLLDSNAYHDAKITIQKSLHLIDLWNGLTKASPVDLVGPVTATSTPASVMTTAFKTPGGKLKYVFAGGPIKPTWKQLNTFKLPLVKVGDTLVPDTTGMPQGDLIGYPSPAVK